MTRILNLRNPTAPSPSTCDCDTVTTGRDSSIHLNYVDFKEMEMVVPVWEGDAVAIKKGFHYNVASPGNNRSVFYG